MKGSIRSAQVWIVVSRCTYPIVYVFPMMGISGGGVTPRSLAVEWPRYQPDTREVTSRKNWRGAAEVAASGRGSDSCGVASVSHTMALAGRR